MLDWLIKSEKYRWIDYHHQAQTLWSRELQNFLLSTEDLPLGLNLNTNLIEEALKILNADNESDEKKK